jgi:hypothetical protein
MVVEVCKSLFSLKRRRSSAELKNKTAEHLGITSSSWPIWTKEKPSWEAGARIASSRFPAFCRQANA